MNTVQQKSLVVDHVNIVKECYHIDKTEFISYKVILNMCNTAVKFDIDVRYISTIKYLFSLNPEFDKTLKLFICPKKFYDVKKDKSYDYYEFKIFDNKFINCGIKVNLKDKQLYKLLINDYITSLSK